VKNTTPRHFPRCILVGSIATACAASFLGTSAAQAETYYWDADGSGTPGFDTVVGAWNTGLFWNSDITGGAGGTTTASPTAADDLNIVQATTTNTGTITMTGTKAASSISFASGVGAVTISGGTSITIGGTGTSSGIFNNSASNQSVSTPLILNSTVSAFNFSNSDAGLLTIGGTVTGTATIGNIQTITIGSSSSGGITRTGSIGNGSAGGKVAVTVNNTSGGVTNFSSGNAYTGGLLIQSGTASAGNFTSAFGGTGNVITLGDATNANATLATTGNTAGGSIGNNIIVAASAGTLSILVGGTNNSSAMNGTITLNSNVTLANSAPIGRTATFSNVISGNFGITAGISTANLSTSVVSLTGANTYNGTTTISFGTLQLGDGTTGKDGTISNSLSIVNNAALRYNRFGETSYSGVISGTGTVTKTGVGTQILTGANTYTGATTVSAGTLSAGTIVVASGSSNLGDATSAVILGSAGTQGTLSYTGNAATFTRGLTIGGLGGGRLDVTTSGQTLTIGTGNVTGSGLFTVGGAGNTTISSNLTHTGGLTKTDAGALTLSGTANTYTGATTITGGTLKLGANNVLPHTVTSTVSIDTATLDADTSTDLAGTLDVTGSAVINLGSGAALSFADSNAVDWTGGTLNITGTFVSGSSLRFGDGTGTGLTSGQLNSISATGWSGFGLDGSGFLTATFGGGSPEIAVEQPALTDIANGGSQGFPTVTLGSNTSLTFTIRNTGTAALNLSGSPLVAVSGTNAGDFTVTAVPTTPVTSGGGTTTFTVQFAPSGAGARSALLTIANSDSDESTFTINVSGTGQTVYDAWSGGAVFNSDPNGDGVKSGLAWILGAAGPNVSALDKLPTVSTSGGNMILTFKRIQASINANTALTIEVGTTLAAWPTIYTVGADTAGSTVGVTVAQNTPIAGTDTVTLTVAQSPDAKKFARLKAVQTP